MRQQGRLGPALISLSSLGLTHLGSVSRCCGLFPLACPMGSLGEHDACHVSLPHAHNATLQDHTTASSCLPPGEPVGQCLLKKEMEAGDKANVGCASAAVSKRAGPSYLITLASAATKIGTPALFAPDTPVKIPAGHCHTQVTARPNEALRELMPFSRPSLACLYLSPPICRPLPVWPTH